MEDECDPDPVTRWQGTLQRHSAPGVLLLLILLLLAAADLLCLACGQAATCRWRVAARNAVAERIAAVLVRPCRSRVGTTLPPGGGGRGRLRRLVIVVGILVRENDVGQETGSGS